MFKENEKVQSGAKKLATLGVKGIIFGSLGLAAVITINASIFNVAAGEIAIEQTPSGTLKAHMTPGYKFKVPFVSKVWYYDEVTTVTYSQVDGDYGASSNNPYDITFADTYGGLVKGSFRVEMPKDPDKFITLHKAFKRYDNFVENGAEKFTNELLAYTANQFTGESFMQGGQNEYKNRLEDQARNGLYETRRTAVKVSKQSGSVGLKNDNASKTSDSEAVIYKNVIQRDTKGAPLRQPNPMDKYGVKVPQVTIDGFIPETDLESFMKNKKSMVRKRAKLIEDQENERQSAITAKLKGDRERVEAKQMMLKERDAAVIQADKEVQLAKKQAERETVERQKLADLAIIDKKKELQVATDNEGIQKANEKAAKFEAQALLHKGLAEAKVINAKYSALMKNKDIVMAEIQRDQTVVLSENLKDFKVELPTYYSSSADGSSQDMNSLKIIMDTMGIKELKSINENTKK
jgi:hypothetical protein